MSDKNYFAELQKVDCSKKIEKKGGFSYLSWAHAVETLGLYHPTATWEVKRFDGLPFLKTDLGYFVEVSVTVDGITKAQIHPVLDNKNQPIKLPNSFQVNTSIQRCLAKAIALHGLGLSLYYGEDIAELAIEERKAQVSQLQPKIDELKQLASDEPVDIDCIRDVWRSLDSHKQQIVWKMLNTKEHAAIRHATQGAAA